MELRSCKVIVERYMEQFRNMALLAFQLRLIELKWTRQTDKDRWIDRDVETNGKYLSRKKMNRAGINRVLFIKQSGLNCFH